MCRGIKKAGASLGVAGPVLESDDGLCSIACSQAQDLSDIGWRYDIRCRAQCLREAALLMREAARPMEPVAKAASPLVATTS